MPFKTSAAGAFSVLAPVVAHKLVKASSTDTTLYAHVLPLTYFAWLPSATSMPQFLAKPVRKMATAQQ